MRYLISYRTPNGPTNPATIIEARSRRSAMAQFRARMKETQAALEASRGYVKADLIPRFSGVNPTHICSDENEDAWLWYRVGR